MQGGVAVSHQFCHPHIPFFCPLGDYVRALSFLTLCGWSGSRSDFWPEMTCVDLGICTETRPRNVFFVAFAIIGAGIEMQAALTWTEGLQLAKLPFDLGQIRDLNRYLA